MDFESEVVPKIKFQELTYGLIGNMVLIKQNPYFNIFTTVYDNNPVFVVAYKYIEMDESLLKVMRNSKFSKIKSKYILKRYGYLVDSYNRCISIVYERVEGQILTFDDFLPTTEENTTSKEFIKSKAKSIYIFEKICQVLKRLSENFIKIGYIHPNLFIYNPDSSTAPIMMLEFSMYKLMRNSLDSFHTQLQFGLLDSITNTVNDNLMMIIFATKALYADPWVDYTTILYAFKKEFFGKLKIEEKTINKGTSNQKNEGVSLENLFNSRSFLDSAYSEKKKNVNKGVLKYEEAEEVTRNKIRKFLNDQVKKLKPNNSTKDFTSKGEIQLDFFNDFSKFSTEFYQLLSCVNCKSEKSGEKKLKETAATKLYPICYEALCNNCYKNHNCSVSTKNNLLCMKKNNTLNIKYIEGVFKKLQSIHQTTEVSNFKNYFEPMINPVLKKIHRQHYVLKTFFSKKNALINDIFYYFNLKVRDLLKEHVNKLNELERKIKLGNFKGEAQEDEYMTKVKIHFDKIMNLINGIIKSNSDYELFHGFRKIIDVAKDYEATLKFYRKNTFETVYYDLTKSIFTYIKDFRIAEDDKLHLAEFYTQSRDKIEEYKYSHIFIPILVSSSINKVSNILKDKNPCSHYATTQEIPSEENIFLPRMKWITRKNITLFTGGYDNKANTAVDTVYLFNSYSLKHSMMVNKTSMNHARDCHALACVNQIFFIVVGGTSTDTCEQYSVLKDEWIDLPKLNQIRANATLFVYNKYLVYCFGGSGYNDVLLDTVEVLDSVTALDKNNSRNFWKELKIENPEKLEIAKSHMGVVKGPRDCVYLLGGKRMFDPEKNIESFSDEIMLFNFNTNIFSSVNKKMQVRGYFREKQFFLLDDVSNEQTFFNFVYNSESDCSIDKAPFIEQFKLD